MPRLLFPCCNISKEETDRETKEGGGGQEMSSSERKKSEEVGENAITFLLLLPSATWGGRGGMRQCCSHFTQHYMRTHSH